MSRALFLTVTVAFGVFSVTGAEAGVMVLGAGKSRACFEAADNQRYARSSLDVCTQALGEDALSQRDRAATLTNRGIIRMGMKDLAGAIEDYERALAIRRDIGEVYVNLGIALLYQQRDREALDALSKGLALNPSRAHVGYYTRAVTHELLGDVRAAYQDYRKAAELAPAWDEPKAQLQRFRVISVQRKLS